MVASKSRPQLMVSRSASDSASEHSEPRHRPPSPTTGLGAMARLEPPRLLRLVSHRSGHSAWNLLKPPERGERECLADLDSWAAKCPWLGIGN